MAAVLGSMLAIAALPAGASAKRFKAGLTAAVDGKPLRVRGKLVVTAYSSTGGFGILSVGGAARPRRRLVRTVGMSCLTGDLATAQLPATFSCAGDYAQVHIGPGALPKTWTTGTGMSVTITFFDGTHVRGTFFGTLEMTPTPADAPVSVSKGAFAAVLRTL